MSYAKLFLRAATFLSLVVFAAATSIVRAQPPPPLPDETEEYPVVTPEDPGAEGDPALAAAELPNTLGQDFEPSNIDPIYFDLPLPEGAPEPEVSAGTITPIALLAGTPYFSYRNKLTVLVGVSADNACHLHLGNGDICRYNRDAAPSVKLYQPVLADAHAKGLNKIRAWVALNGGDFVDSNAGCATRKPHPEDQPFLYTANASGPYGIGTWRLDQRNAAYFDHLREVVQFAKSLNPPMIVEVTFFAPWEAVWELGPWHKDHGRNASGAIGFTDRSYFVRIDTNAATQAQNEGMRQYQKKVMEWTVDALIDFDNVYWEIANEPEAWKTSAPTCGPSTNLTVVGPKPQTALAAEVGLWQNEMIKNLKMYEAGKLAAAGLTRPHVIAVQPFSTEGANLAKAHPNIQVVNGHYTTVSPGHGGLGAITLVQTHASTMKAKGYNEGKISAIPGNQGIYAPANQPAGSELTDVSRVRAVRAEAWELMIGGAAAYDHYGYHYSSPVGAATRTQLGALRSFLDAWKLLGMKASADPPTWIGFKQHTFAVAENVNWAALETKPGEPRRRYVAHSHHSRSRAGQAFQGYQPLPGSYTDTLYMCFGSKAGKFVVKWKNLETNVETTLPELVWPGMRVCDPRLSQGARTTLGPYSYDILITVEEKLP